jgi:hypothetical protein
MPRIRVRKRAQSALFLLETKPLASCFSGIFRAAPSGVGYRLMCVLNNHDGRVAWRQLEPQGEAVSPAFQQGEAGRTRHHLAPNEKANAFRAASN